MITRKLVLCEKPWYMLGNHQSRLSPNSTVSLPCWRWRNNLQPCRDQHHHHHHHYHHGQLTSCGACVNRPCVCYMAGKSVIPALPTRMPWLGATISVSKFVMERKSGFFGSRHRWCVIVQQQQHHGNWGALYMWAFFYVLYFLRTFDYSNKRYLENMASFFFL